MKDTHPPTCNPAMPPDEVVLSKLRDHFRSFYELDADQVEVMVESAAKSVDSALKDCSEVLWQENPRESLEGLLHRLKGLFLNMGESEWAAFAAEIQLRLKTTEEIDYKGVIAEFQNGLAQIVAYSSEKEKYNR